MSGFIITFLEKKSNMCHTKTVIVSLSMFLLEAIRFSYTDFIEKKQITTAKSEGKLL